MEFTPPRIAIVVDKKRPSPTSCCKPAHSEQAYDTVFGEVVSAFADDRVFCNGRWSFSDDNADWHTLHHLGGGAFAVPSRVVQGRLLTG